MQIKETTLVILTYALLFCALVSCGTPPKKEAFNTNVSELHTLFSIGKSISELEKENGLPKEAIGNRGDKGFNGRYIYLVSDARSEFTLQDDKVIGASISVHSSDPGAFTNYVQYLEKILGSPSRRSLKQIEWEQQGAHVLVSGSNGKYDVIVSSR